MVSSLSEILKGVPISAMGLFPLVETAFSVYLLSDRQSERMV